MNDGGHGGGSTGAAAGAAQPDCLVLTRWILPC
jgi:hypothetical protein